MVKYLSRALDIKGISKFPCTFFCVYSKAFMYMFCTQTRDYTTLKPLHRHTISLTKRLWNIFIKNCLPSIPVMILTPTNEKWILAVYKKNFLMYVEARNYDKKIISMTLFLKAYIYVHVTERSSYRNNFVVCTEAKS